VRRPGGDPTWAETSIVTAADNDGPGVAAALVDAGAPIATPPGVDRLRDHDGRALPAFRS